MTVMTAFQNLASSAGRLFQIEPDAPSSDIAALHVSPGRSEILDLLETHLRLNDLLRSHHELRATVRLAGQKIAVPIQPVTPRFYCRCAADEITPRRAIRFAPAPEIREAHRPSLLQAADDGNDSQRETYSSMMPLSRAMGYSLAVFPGVAGL
jgi:hypothetical protein